MAVDGIVIGERSGNYQETSHRNPARGVLSSALYIFGLRHDPLKPWMSCDTNTLGGLIPKVDFVETSDRRYQDGVYGGRGTGVPTNRAATRPTHPQPSEI